MHAERDAVVASRLSKRVYISSNFFWHSGRGIILVFEPQCRYKISTETPLAG